MTRRAQTIVCTTPVRPQAKQRLVRRVNRLPNDRERQQGNATQPILIGYARVSRAEGQDLTPQVSALEAAGCRRIHEERASGGRWDRPELTRLLGRLTAGDVLVVWKLDRLSRSLKDLLLILERISAVGAGFRSLTESIDTTVPAGRMMMQMLGAFAEYEREMVKERTQAGGPSRDLGDHNDYDRTGRICCRLGIHRWNGRCVWLERGLMVNPAVSR